MNNTAKNTAVIFHTNTQIDPRSWRIMGISAKETSNPIGLWGTGMKYAIAVFLRLGHKVSIKTEGQTYEFSAKEMVFRDKTFEQVLCNGEELPYTTEYGKLWEPWMAYRELVSNTMDEGGIHFAGEPFDHGTSIIIEGENVRECLANHDDYFVGSREPIAEMAGLRIYEGNGTIFYRGVKVGMVENAMYSYEMLHDLTLTEDRTIAFQYQIPQKVGMCVVRYLKDKALIKRFCTAPAERWEGKLDYDWENWSEEFTEVAKDLWKNNPTKLNESIFRLVRKKCADIGWEAKDLNEDHEVMLDNAKAFLKMAGYEVTAPVKMVDNDDQKCIAFYYNGVIHLTEKCFEEGAFKLTRILMEENFHAYGYSDACRSFEDYLQKELIKQASKRLKVSL